MFVLSVCMVVCLDVFFFSLRVDIHHLFVCLSFYVSLCLCLCISLSLYPSIYLPSYLSRILFIPYVCHSVILFIPDPSIIHYFILLSTFSLIILSQKRKKKKMREKIPHLFNASIEAMAYKRIRTPLRGLTSTWNQSLCFSQTSAMA